MEAYWFLLGVLAVWRVTHLLQAEDGPWNLVVRLRRAVGHGFWGHLLDCFACLSLWIAAPAAGLLGRTWTHRALLWLALSGGAILLSRLTQARSSTPAAQYYEDEETDHVVLWKTEEPARGESPKPPIP